VCQNNVLIKARKKEDMKNFYKLSNLFFVLALVAGLLGLAQPARAAAEIAGDLWVTNAMVTSSLLSGNTLYIGGSFTYVGPPTGGFGVLNASGVPDRAFPPVGGSISAIAPDGVGGWYIAGHFTNVGGYPCSRLVHLKADKSLDFAWKPNPNNDVTSLAVANGTVYVGGIFTNIGGQDRNYIAALDAGSGRATAWNPGANDRVLALVVAPPTSGTGSSTIYAGGGFTAIGGQPRDRIAALDATTGIATAWNPSASGGVYALAVAPSIAGDGSNTIYVGGAFTYIGKQSRWYIAALDASSGLATDWNPNADDVVYTLGVNGSTVYAGGKFYAIGRQRRNQVAALNAATGDATAWNPDVRGELPVVKTLLASSDTIYIGGQFNEAGGQPRHHIAALNASTGLATGWSPNADFVVDVLAASGSTISAGGGFRSIGGQIRNNIAALDITTGAPTAWNPNANGNVHFMAISGSTLYVGGWFSAIGGQSRNNIAALDTATGLATTWNPDANGGVYTLALSGNTVYAGGAFTSVDGQSRNRIAALDATSGHATPWNPNANGTLSTLAVAGSTIYAGGSFTTIGSANRNHIAALDASSGLATPWNPNANEWVATLVVAPDGSTIYAGGSFTNIGGVNRSQIAVLNTTSGLATSWNPNGQGSMAGINPAVYNIVLNGSTVYVGGEFTSIGGQNRIGIAELDAGSGLATAWNPGADDVVRSLVVVPSPLGGSARTIYAAGGFTAINRQERRSLAALRNGPATCQSAASGGSWRASNWSNCGGTIPGAGDSVEIQAGHNIKLYSDLAANDLTIQAGGELDLPVGVTLSVEGALTQNGRFTQTRTVLSGVPTAFLNIRNAAGSADQYFGLTLTPVGDMGDTRVTIAGNQNCTSDPADVLLQRCFEVSPATPRRSVARFYYSQAELNGQIYNRLNVLRQTRRLPQGMPYRYSATCAAGQQDCWVEAINLAVYARFVFDSKVYPATFLPLIQR
jgi:uncharacterized membrane protein YtjA (UPF0391 family)